MSAPVQPTALRSTICFAYGKQEHDRCVLRQNIIQRPTPVISLKPGYALGTGEVVREVSPMSGTISRRNLLQIGGGAAATLGLSAVAGELAPVRAFDQSAPVRSVKDDYKEDLFYR